jgi:hypothetical protein
MSAAKDLGLTLVPADDAGSQGFSIWDGSKFVYRQVGVTWKIVTQ